MHFRWYFWGYYDFKNCPPRSKSNPIYPAVPSIYQNSFDHEDQEHRPYSFSNVQTLYTTLWWYPKANTETRFESLSSIYPAVIPTISLAVLSIYPDIYLCHITWPYFQLCQAKHISGCATCPQLSINMLYSTTFWTENVTISPMSVWVIKKPPCHCWKMSLLA